MLTLGRGEDESIHLYTADGMISITVRHAKGGQAKLSINAPREVNFVRAEIDDRTSALNSPVLAGNTGCTS